MTRASLERTILNASARWPPWPEPGWGHAGAPAGNFHNTEREFNARAHQRRAFFANIDSLRAAIAPRRKRAPPHLPNRCYRNSFRRAAASALRRVQ